MKTGIGRAHPGIEAKLRTDKFKDDFFALLEEDINELINPYRASFATVNCPCCDRRETSEAFVKGQFSFHACPSCDTLFINPRPTIETLDNFYINSKAIVLFTRELMKNEKARTKYIFDRRAQQVLEFLRSVDMADGRLVEVGCSIGTFLEIIKEQSRFSVEGIDPDEAACRACAGKGITAHKTTLESFKAGSARYDIALNFETIEHIFSPFTFLNKINHLLKMGGYLGFTTPNRHGFDMMVLGRSFKNIHGPCHLNYFNVDTVDRLLERSGFRVVQKLTPGILDVEVVRKQIAAGVAPDVPPFIKYLACDADDRQRSNFQEFLGQNRMSGNMLVFAQKVGKAGE
ncbi:class I SAM-dependent methyltransferase [Candidatus Saganbacteria bacterium]|nr:class I SAM-dependent methyltransferase [Candidatus Saganbacteria bacterium]